MSNQRRARQATSMATIIVSVAVLSLQLGHARRARQLAERRLARLTASTGEGDKAVLHWRHQALHDELTDLANRGGLLESLELLATPSPRGGRRCAVLYGDLDFFKQVNDTYGHAAGDQILVTTAERLRELVRQGDTVARLGGDEFVVVVDSVGDSSDALEIAERIRRYLAEPVLIGGTSVRVTASFGIAVGSDHSASALLDRADAALYEAKRAGRNRCFVWTANLAVPTGVSFRQRRL